jgi:3-dehydroquinate dehydratase-2
MTRVLVLNGPNLRRLGSREPDVYGTDTYDDLVAACQETAKELGLDVDVRQTDDETELVAWLHEAADSAAPVVLNPAAFTHYSYALRDACAMLTATGSVTGLGLDSYRLALRAIARLTSR